MDRLEHLNEKIFEERKLHLSNFLTEDGILDYDALVKHEDEYLSSLSQTIEVGDIVKNVGVILDVTNNRVFALDKNLRVRSHSVDELEKFIGVNPKTRSLLQEIIG